MTTDEKGDTGIETLAEPRSKFLAEETPEALEAHNSCRGVSSWVEENYAPLIPLVPPTGRH